MYNLIRNVPNLLSSLRLVIAVFFPFSPQKYWIWLIICGGSSDFFDGWIARRWNLTSWNGRVLDAVADKIFMFSILSTFVLTNNLNIWIVPAVIIRDLVVVVIAVYTHYCRAWDSFRQIKSRLSGKVATAGQFLLLATLAVAPIILQPILIISILLSSYAAADYALEFVKAVSHRSRQ